MACRRAVAELVANQPARKAFAVPTDIANELLLDMWSACGHPKVGDSIAVFVPLKIAVGNKVRLRRYETANQKHQRQSQHHCHPRLLGKPKRQRMANDETALKQPSLQGQRYFAFFPTCQILPSLPTKSAQPLGLRRSKSGKPSSPKTRSAVDHASALVGEGRTTAASKFR